MPYLYRQGRTVRILTGREAGTVGVIVPAPRGASVPYLVRIPMSVLEPSRPGVPADRWYGPDDLRGRMSRREFGALHPDARSGTPEHDPRVLGLDPCDGGTCLWPVDLYDPETGHMEIGSSEWFRAWAEVWARYPEVERAEQWQYMGTYGGRHQFRHRGYPTLRGGRVLQTERIYVDVPCDPVDPPVTTSRRSNDIPEPYDL